MPEMLRFEKGVTTQNSGSTALIFQWETKEPSFCGHSIGQSPPIFLVQDI